MYVSLWGNINFKHCYYNMLHKMYRPYNYLNNNVLCKINILMFGMLPRVHDDIKTCFHNITCTEISL